MLTGLCTLAEIRSVHTHCDISALDGTRSVQQDRYERLDVVPTNAAIALSRRSLECLVFVMCNIPKFSSETSVTSRHETETTSEATIPMRGWLDRRTRTATAPIGRIDEMGLRSASETKAPKTSIEARQLERLLKRTIEVMNCQNVRVHE